MMIQEDLKRRIPKQSDEYRASAARLIELYGIKPNIKNFMSGVFSFTDEDGRLVELVPAEIRAGQLSFNHKTSADAVVATSGTVQIGWAKTDKIITTDTFETMSVKSLTPMPTVNRFRQQCTHMVEHGGWFDGNNWQCLGCGTELVFNDRQPVR
jgi:hypothetical protein